MTKPAKTTDEAQGEKPGRETLIDEMRAAFAEAEAMARTEIAYQSARLALGAKILGRIACLGLVALALVFFALMALVVGLLLALVPIIGVWGALGLMVAALLLACVAALIAMKAGARRLRRLFTDKADDARQDTPL